jgi:hypothetical protein
MDKKCKKRFDFNCYLSPIFGILANSKGEMDIID